MSQMCFLNRNLPLKQRHLSIQDTLQGPQGVYKREVPLYYSVSTVCFFSVSSNRWIMALVGDDLQAVLCGDYSSLPPPESSTVRIFLSSTFGGQ